MQEVRDNRLRGLLSSCGAAVAAQVCTSVPVLLVRTSGNREAVPSPPAVEKEI